MRCSWDDEPATAVDRYRLSDGAVHAEAFCPVHEQAYRDLYRDVLGPPLDEGTG